MLVESWSGTDSKSLSLSSSHFCIVIRVFRNSLLLDYQICTRGFVSDMYESFLVSVVVLVCIVAHIYCRIRLCIESLQKIRPGIRALDWFSSPLNLEQGFLRVICMLEMFKN